MAQNLIVDGVNRGIVKEYYQNRDTGAWIFDMETDPVKASSMKIILFFDEIRLFSYDKDNNLDIVAM